MDSPICHYLLNVKDHFTRQVYLKPLTSKSAAEVAHELGHYYSMFGYPIIFHTDNGTEFKAEVLQKLKELNPVCFTVKGKPRTPREQGSVERSNSDIKAIIAKSVKEKRDSVTNPEEKKKISWTTEYQLAMRSVNASKSKGLGQVTPYEHIFSMHYHEPMWSHLDQMNNLDIDNFDDLLQFIGPHEKERLIKMERIDVNDGIMEDVETFLNTMSKPASYTKKPILQQNNSAKKPVIQVTQEEDDRKMPAKVQYPSHTHPTHPAAQKYIDFDDSCDENNNDNTTASSLSLPIPKHVSSKSKKTGPKKKKRNFQPHQAQIMIRTQVHPLALYQKHTTVC